MRADLQHRLRVWLRRMVRRLARRLGRSRRLDEACRRNARAAEALDAAVKEMLRQ
jgi:hypothetical protein